MPARPKPAQASPGTFSFPFPFSPSLSLSLSSLRVPLPQPLSKPLPPTDRPPSPPTTTTGKPISRQFCISTHPSLHPRHPVCFLQSQCGVLTRFRPTLCRPCFRFARPFFSPRSQKKNPAKIPIDLTHGALHAAHAIRFCIWYVFLIISRHAITVECVFLHSLLSAASIGGAVCRPRLARLVLQPFCSTAAGRGHQRSRPGPSTVFSLFLCLFRRLFQPLLILDLFVCQMQKKSAPDPRHFLLPLPPADTAALLQAVTPAAVV